MKAMLSKYWLLLGLVAIIASPILAQTDMQAEKVRTELERTDEVIERAVEAVRSTNAPMAAVALKRAMDFQREARGCFNRRWHFKAYKLTFEAREQAKSALVRCRLTEQGETVVLRKLERAAELLERAKEAMPPGPEGRLRAIYESAKNNLNRAWEFYRIQRYRAALKLANQVTNAGQDILNAANRQIRRYAEFERRAEAVAELIAKAREKIAECSSDDALRLVEQAHKMYRLSGELASESKYAAALRNLQQARKMAIEASKMCNGVGALSRRYDRIRSEAHRLAERISPDDNTAKRLLKQVHEQLRLAEDSISREQTEAAAASLKAAHLMLNQLKKHLTGGGR